jgi:hypothetical protein
MTVMIEPAALKVKSCDLLIAAIDLVGSVGIGWAQRYIPTMKCREL